MEQLTLFAETGQSKGLPKDLLEYQPGLIDPAMGDWLLEKLIRETPWKQPTQKLWDKEYLTPRLTCWYGHRPDRRNTSLDTGTANYPGNGRTFSGYYLQQRITKLLS